MRHDLADFVRMQADFGMQEVIEPRRLLAARSRADIPTIPTRKMLDHGTDGMHSRCRELHRIRDSVAHLTPRPLWEVCLPVVAPGGRTLQENAGHSPGRAL